MVWPLLPRPSMQDWSSHHAEDIGARFAVPSSFRELISTTGVPKYNTFNVHFLAFHGM